MWHPPTLRNPLTTLLVLALLIRLLTLSLPAIGDTSEGRFASTAQEMLLSGNWITPQIYNGEAGWQPYWAKPPFHMWSAALSMALIGQNELAARLPSFLGSLVVVLTIFWFMHRSVAPSIAWRSICILCSMIGFVGLSGMCITDMLLTMSITVTTACAGVALLSGASSGSRRWWVVAAVSAGFGMLTKGPVSIALPALTIALYSLLQVLCGERDATWIRNIPWLKATVVFGAIWLPWYLLAEWATPGFLHYYFIQENFLRYFQSGVEIKYGIGHREPPGIIWFYWVVMTLPWALLPLGMRISRSPGTLKAWILEHRAESYLLCWAATPMIFFTGARNVLITYTLAALPPTAGLLAIILNYGAVRSVPAPLKKYTTFTLVVLMLAYGAWSFLTEPSLAGALLVVTALCMLWLYPNLHYVEMRILALTMICLALVLPGASIAIGQHRSTQPILDAIQSQSKNPTLPIGILLNNPRSAVFYARRAEPQSLQVIGGLDEKRADELGLQRLIIHKRNLSELSEEFRGRFEERLSLGSWTWLEAKTESSPLSTQQP